MDKKETFSAIPIPDKYCNQFVLKDDVGNIKGQFFSKLQTFSNLKLCNRFTGVLVN